MKDRKHDAPNYFPRLPFIILAVAGIILLAANVIFIYVSDEYPKTIGIALFAVYSVLAVIIIAVQSSHYKFLNEVNERSSAFNTEIINMFKYVSDIPYAVISGDGTAVVVNNALQNIIGENDTPIFNRPLSEICSLVSANGAETQKNDLALLDAVKSTVENRGKPLMVGRDKNDMSTLWSYKLDPNGVTVKIGNLQYEPRAYEIMVEGETYYFTVFTEIEDIIEFRERMSRNNTVVAYIVPDNLEQIDQNLRSGYREAAAKLEATLRHFARSIDAFIREYDRDKYMLVFTREKLDECRANNYRILSDVREISVGTHDAEHRGSDVVLTVSIGIADIHDTMQRREEMAKNALELAIHRGGDQVVVHTVGETEYYGGHIKEITGNTIIDAKNAAQQVWHNIAISDSVFIMGHSFPDFDSIASCVGLARVAYDILSKIAGDRAYNDVYRDDSIAKSRIEELERLRERAINARRIAEINTRNKVKVIVDRSNTSFLQFYDMLMRTSTNEDKEFYKKLFVSGSAAPDLIPSDALLILTDVSNYKIVESAEAVDIAERIVIIDHHRSGILTREPVYKFIKSGASSASEIVASMIEHGNAAISLTKPEATLMLAGIMLDTNKFSRNTTDLTFAATQYLIRCGADQDEAREFFLDKYSVYLCESQILASRVEIYKGIALAMTDIGRELTGDDRIAASKAADRLITIQGVNAAFTLMKAKDTVSISARSNGKINVQRIVEKLGGGGHFNMAGAQIKDNTLETVFETLKGYIDEYYEQEDGKKSDKGSK